MIGRLLLVTGGGFLASAHCIGMCGGFACAVAASNRAFWPVFLRQLVYNSGRIFTYAFLGILAGATGTYLSRFRLGLFDVQQVFATLAGVLMLCLGLAALQIVRLPQRWLSTAGSLFSPIFAYFLEARGWLGYFLAGLANGFLPCGLVYAFLAVAASTGDAFQGLLVMVFFGIGTLPAMLLSAGGFKVLNLAARRRVHQTAAIFVVALGVVTIWRGWPSPNPQCCNHTGAVDVATSH